MKEIKCLKCGGELIIDDCLEEEFGFPDVYRILYGHCAECGAEHDWNEVYKFSHYDKLRVDD